jgi:hypothetical protein
MTGQKMMGRAIFSSFLLAGAIILAGAFLAPQAALTGNSGCNSAYGIDGCSTEQAAR